MQLVAGKPLSDLIPKDGMRLEQIFDLAMLRKEVDSGVVQPSSVRTKDSVNTPFTGPSQS
jgi:hypothetical protein